MTKMKVFMRKIGAFCACVAAFTMLAAPAVAGELVMGLIPAENNEEMVKEFEPMRAYLELKTGRKVKVFTATDYTGVIEAMRKKRVDIAWFGPLSYCLAEQEAGAEAFAAGIRKVQSLVDGSCSLLLLTDDGIYAARDRFGRTPVASA